MSLVLELETPAGPERHPLSPGLTIGRSEDNAVVLASRHVSRRHARIEADGGVVGIVDLGSANGTLVNGTAIEPRTLAPLRQGDHLEFGDFRAVVRAGQAAPPKPDPVTVAGPRPSLFVMTPHAMEKVEIAADVLTIGRAPECTIVVDEPQVSQRHAIIRRVGNLYQVEDLGSTNGVVIGGERITFRILHDRDVFSIGDGVSFCFLAPEGAADLGPALLLVGAGQEIVIGRDAASGFVSDHPSVSRRHARVTGLAGGGGTIEDLGSTNGTFVNGHRIDSGRAFQLAPGDAVQTGSVQFAFRVPGAAGAPLEGVALLAAKAGRSTGKGVRLLNDVTLRIQAREFVAIVGASGVGKTSLLRTLAGIAPATDGRVLLFGHDVALEFDALRTLVGYVPQEDILHRELPVVNALRYEADLRLPKDTTRAERDARIADVLEVLGIADRAETKIAVLSGGERKRVAIAAELLTRPGIFFLDEATSGLDPGNEAQFMRLLRRLADDGHTVVLVTHATKNVMLCDQVVFLAKGGELAFAGPPDEALDYFGTTDFDGIYDRLASEPEPATVAERFRRSPGYTRLAEAESAALPERSQRTSAAAPARPPATRQFSMLVRRQFDIVRRDRLTFLLLLLIAPLAGAINFAAWPRDVLDPIAGETTRAIAMCYILSLFCFLIGALLNVREFVKERAVFARERMVGLGLAPYLAAKLLFSGGFAVYHGVILAGFAVLALDLEGFSAGDYASLTLSFVLSVVGAAALGLLGSALARREEQAIFFVIGAILTSVILSGGILPLGDLGAPGKAASAVATSNWSFRSMITGLKLERGDCDLPGLETCEMPGFAAFETEGEREVALRPINERYADVVGTRQPVAWAGIAVLTVISVAGAAFVLRSRDALRGG